MRILLALLCLLSLPGPARAQGEAAALCRAAIARAEAAAAIPPGLLHAIGRVESGRRDPQTGSFGPWPWTINAEGRGHFLPSREAAIALARDLQGRGVRSFDVGCMQINLHHHPRAFASLEEAFDPEANARYAARFLTELQSTRQDWMLTASHYHSQTPELAAAYRARVQSAWAQGGAAVMAAAPPPAPPRSLGNGAERVQVAMASPGLAGRGLDAYRAQPVPLAARSLLPVARRSN